MRLLEHEAKALLEAGEDLSIPLEGQIIYYVGPAPARPGEVIGPAGRTTAGQVDPYTPPLLARGLIRDDREGKPERRSATGLGGAPRRLLRHRATHIAAIPLAVNLDCHLHRHVEVVM